MNLSIIILAAGKGSRMKSSTAKVLHPISGKEMLYFIIKESLKISDDITVVIHHQKEAVQEAMMKHFGTKINFHIQDADNFPGTGGAVMGIKPVHEKVLVLNGDMPLITAQALKGFEDSKADITMSIFDLEDSSGYGRVIIGDNGVERIVEEKDASAQEKAVSTVNAGIYSFSKSVIQKYLPKLSNDNAQAEYYLTDVIAMAKADDLIIEPLLVDEEHFKGVNSKFDLATAEEIMQARIKEAWMKTGVSMQLPSTIYIEESVEFEGECLLENGTRLCGNTLIKDSNIKSGSVVEDSIIKSSDIGPLAHIRPHSHIQDTHIGNFVEVKKSTLKGVKAGHLAYLGDSQIDEGTNVGAGVITCNYDGANKHQTIIGDGAFIGSDSQLIAPVTIGKNATIGAGSNITKDTPDGQLTFSRSKQTTMKNWERPVKK